MGLNSQFISTQSAPYVMALNLEVNRKGVYWLQLTVECLSTLLTLRQLGTYVMINLSLIEAVVIPVVEEIKFHERIKILRSERNMTQHELGDLLGVTGQAVSKWENGLATPDITLLPKIAMLFNCTIDSLFFGGAGSDSQDSKTMTRVNFAEAKIECSNLRGIVMRDVVMDGAEIFDSRLNGMRIHHGGMANLSLRHLDLDGLSLGFSQMNGAVIHDLGGHTKPIRFAENDFKGRAAWMANG